MLTQMKNLEFLFNVVASNAPKDIVKVLENRWVWIIDSGASSHSTAHGEQFSVKRDTNATSVGATGPAVAADFEESKQGQKKTSAFEGRRPSAHSQSQKQRPKSKKR